MGMRYSFVMEYARQSSRCKGWDYSQSGAYFVTLCSRQRNAVFGEIRDGVMGLNKFGCLAWNEWHLLAKRRCDVTLDEFVVMPNHLHLILFIANDVPATYELGHKNERIKLTSGSLGAVIGGFKSGVTREIGRMRGQRTRVWQRLFYDRVVRDERELLLMRQYIHNNVLNWHKDKHFR